ncbi:MAG: hypothetical protein WAN30_09895 [Acidimicrobiales bacterium]
MSDANPSDLGFGDTLALARLAWIREMSARLERSGFADYRRSDAFVVRRLARSAMTIGTLGIELSMTRQGARKVVDTLIERGYAHLERDESDARKSRVTLTRRGHDYARTIVHVIATMNAELRASVGARALDETARVLNRLRQDFSSSPHS